MELANGLMAAPIRPREVVESVVLLLAPFAPHIAEELWGKLGHHGTLAYAPWPSFDPALAQEEQREYVVQVNGKLRHRFQAAATLDAGALLEAAKAEPQVAALLQGKTIAKEPNRLATYVGAAKAAAKLGDNARAKQYTAKIMALTKDADSQRPEVMELRMSRSASATR